VVVRQARDAGEVAQALELRRRVFSVEQGVSAASDQDGRDGEAIHIVALDEGALRGTCRVLITHEVAALGRMVVEAGERRRGVGRAVLAGAERAARDAGVRRVVLHAQLPAEDFYAQSGYTTSGRRFVEQGIAHIAMEKRLA